MVGILTGPLEGLSVLIVDYTAQKSNKARILKNPVLSATTPGFSSISKYQDIEKGLFEQIISSSVAGLTRRPTDSL